MLTQFQSDDTTFQLMQNSWATDLNPLLSNPINKANILKNVALLNGTTQVNHKLQRKLQGWFIVRQRGLASIYDTQDLNQTPQLTLSLVSNNAVVVDIAVF